MRFDTVTQGRLAADVRRLSDEINWDYAVIERLNQDDLTTTLIPFNLGKAVLEGDAAQQPGAHAGDVVTVFSKTDVSAPATRRSVVVSLEGEFNFAGVYQAKPGETLRQLIVACRRPDAGGLPLRRRVHARVHAQDAGRAPARVRSSQYEQDLQRAAASRARNVTSAEDAASLKAEAEAQQAMVARLQHSAAYGTHRAGACRRTRPLRICRRCRSKMAIDW